MQQLQQPDLILEEPNNFVIKNKSKYLLVVIAHNLLKTTNKIELINHFNRIIVTKR